MKWILVYLQCTTVVSPMVCDYLDLKASPEFTSERRCFAAARAQFRKLSGVNGLTCVERHPQQEEPGQP